MNLGFIGTGNISSDVVTAFVNQKYLLKKLFYHQETKRNLEI